MKNHNPIKIRPAIKYHGGKSFMARRILSYFPEHHTYIEPFAGGLSVLLNKYRSPIEIAGDLDTDLIQFYTTLRDSGNELIDRIRSLPYQEEVFQRAITSQTTDRLERAVNMVVRFWMSRGGMGVDFSRTDDGRNEHSWARLPDALYATARRLQDVRLMVVSVFDLLPLYDHPDTLIYADPPYYPATRDAPKVYQHELTELEHVKLVTYLRDCQSHVVLSGFACGVYDSILVDWERVEIDNVKRSSQKKDTRNHNTEILWVKPDNRLFS